MITIAIMLVMAFAVGLTVLRQTRAIWEMDSPNAVSMNNTMNTFTSIEPSLILIIIVAIAIGFMSTRRAF